MKNGCAALGGTPIFASHFREIYVSRQGKIKGDGQSGGAVIGAGGQNQQQNKKVFPVHAGGQPPAQQVPQRSGGFRRRSHWGSWRPVRRSRWGRRRLRCAVHPAVGAVALGYVSVIHGPLLPAWSWRPRPVGRSAWRFPVEPAVPAGHRAAVRAITFGGFRPGRFGLQWRPTAAGYPAMAGTRAAFPASWAGESVCPAPPAASPRPGAA